MHKLLLLVLSVSVGIMVVIQGSINARLGVLLNNTLLATTAALIISTSFTVMTVFATVRQFPSTSQLKEIPLYMWFVGGVLSFIAISLFYYVIPRLGISTAVTFGLVGQIIFAAIVGHFAWFGVPLEPISLKKIGGIVILISGLIIIKS